MAENKTIQLGCTLRTEQNVDLAEIDYLTEITNQSK